MNPNRYIKKITKRLKRLANHFGVCPIEVFVFHAVSDSFDPSQCLRGDWSSTADFKERIAALKRRYTFITLPEAHHKLKTDLFRSKRYAVLTCDDGMRTVLSILPYLETENIPITLFLNAKYLDGVSKRDHYTEKPEYITQGELEQIVSPVVTIGMHGFEHVDHSTMTRQQFVTSIVESKKLLEKHPAFIPYFAYPWGRFNPSTQQWLKMLGVTPVLSDGRSNYRYINGIDRKCVDSPSF
ncbi:MAG: polysaccharide deacetylase family protein [Bacteroidales bacterium]|nr:polysaccharide deacetylase family protein [Bacteroidales bacterium]